jgi:hypothetical protein
MYAKPVLERVKVGLGEEAIRVFQPSSSNGSEEPNRQSLLEQFLRNALEEVSKQKPIRRQLLLKIGKNGIVPLPAEVCTVESVRLEQRPLTQKNDPASLSRSDYVLDHPQCVIRLTPDAAGEIEVNCTMVPREREIPHEARHALVLHVKAQCCEYIANQLRTNPSLKISKKNELLNNPVHWEREGGKLRLKLSNEPPIAP